MEADSTSEKSRVHFDRYSFFNIFDFFISVRLCLCLRLASAIKSESTIFSG